MSSLKASPAQLNRILQARTECGWAIESDKWLLAASKILQPSVDWDLTDQRAVASSTWKRFLRGEPVRPQTYKAFCQVLGLNWQETIDIPSQNVKLANNRDWGEILDISTFFSRSSELATLERWIKIDRVRTIAILGMGGIGKTSLAAKGL